MLVVSVVVAAIAVVVIAAWEVASVIVLETAGGSADVTDTATEV